MRLGAEPALVIQSMHRLPGGLPRLGDTLKQASIYLMMEGVREEEAEGLQFLPQDFRGYTIRDVPKGRQGFASPQTAPVASKET